MNNVMTIMCERTPYKECKHIAVAFNQSPCNMCRARTGDASDDLLYER